jgi:ribosome maturation factor RimP
MFSWDGPCAHFLLMNYRQDLHDIIQPAVKAVGYELYGCEFIKGSGTGVLRVYIDSANGITIDDCEKASRQISAVLDVEDPIRSPYDLEVSSPGIERALFTEAHFQRARGSRAHIKLMVPIEKQRVFEGEIKRVADGKVELQASDAKSVMLEIGNMTKANLIFESKK